MEGGKYLLGFSVFEKPPHL